MVYFCKQKQKVLKNEESELHNLTSNMSGRPAKPGPSKTTEIQSAKPDKRPFDKKKWRENKYSNKLKGKI
jgi:hypothetical protein